jgi:carbonic anhydrase
MIISCCDSRIHVTSIFGADLGEFFIHRNIANLVPPYNPDGDHHGTSAAVEYAVKTLRVSNIIILGHSHCGGIRCLCEGNERSNRREFIDGWMSIVDHAINFELKGEKLHRNVEKEAVKISTNNLLSFPWIKDRVVSGGLKIHGW